MEKKLLSAAFAANSIFLFFTSDKIQPTHLTQGFLLLLTVASVWCFNRKSGCMEKYRAKGSAIIPMAARDPFAAVWKSTAQRDPALPLG